MLLTWLNATLSRRCARNRGGDIALAVAGGAGVNRSPTIEQPF